MTVGDLTAKIWVEDLKVSDCVAAQSNNLRSIYSNIRAVN